MQVIGYTDITAIIYPILSSIPLVEVTGHSEIDG
jgi:hypothetical protein